jgi:hypothetical protein
MIDGLPGRSYCLVDVRSVAVGNRRKSLTGRRVDGIEGLPGSGGHPLALDEHPSVGTGRVHSP